MKAAEFNYAARDAATQLIEDEHIRASMDNLRFNSAHEGFAVILEEVDELKAHVWQKAEARDLDAMRKEAVQIGAMALRFILDICPPVPEKREDTPA